jgi:diguanylate cyclase (GGDEF)-like protein/PAS domain S-box-containing protein
MTTATAEPHLEAGARPAYLQLVRVALVLLLLSFSSNWLNAASWGSGSINILWPSTGFLIGVLLCAPRRRWPAFIFVGFLVDLLINVSPPLKETLGASFYYAGCNVIEVVLAASLLHRRIAPDLELSRPRQLIALLFYGAILATAVASAFAAMWSDGSLMVPNFYSFLSWFTSDALGIAIMTPLYVSWRKQSLFTVRPPLEIAALLLLLGALSILVFWQTSFPLLFVLVPCLLLLGTRLGLTGSAIGLLAVSVIGGYFTAHQQGPLALVHTSATTRILVFKFFLAVCILTLYIVEVLLNERKRFELSLSASEGRFRLLAEGSLDIIMLNDLHKNCQYVSPAVSKILGWEPEEYRRLCCENLIHPDDLLSFNTLFEKCRAGEPSNRLVFRAKQKSGSYLWMEANLVLHRSAQTGAPTGFINVIRDVSSRKAAEEKLNRALNEAESLASIDPLTGIANRRSFEEFFEIEWQRSMRPQTDFSLLLIDVDHFKQYNDLYGHLTGDSCLKLIAETIRATLHRATDLLARYGGEEFAVVLPHTSAEGAHSLAQQIRTAIENLRIPHDGSPHHIVTLSIGCATQIPLPNSPRTSFLERADKALYEAKSAGRNCIRQAEQPAIVFEK